MLDLFDEIDGRLTRVLIRWPDAWGVIWPIQKHVKYALANDKTTDLKDYLEKTRGRLTAAMVNYPEMQEDFFPLTRKIDEELGVSRETASRTPSGT